MPEKRDVSELDLTDAELIELLNSHGLSRRLLMRLFGVGTVTAALGGTASAQSDQGPRIDEVYGAPFADGENVPSGLVDATVELIIQPGEEENIHPGFPVDPETGGEIPAEFFFDPVGLHVNPGSVVDFRTVAGLHTATAFHPKYGEPPEFTLPNRVPTDHAFTSPPVVNGDAWLYRFTTQGVYDILCLPHLELGMVMRVVVSGDDTVPEADYGTLAVPNAGDVLGSDDLTPSNIVDAGSVVWSDLSL